MRFVRFSAWSSALSLCAALVTAPAQAQAAPVSQGAMTPQGEKQKAQLMGFMSRGLEGVMQKRPKLDTFNKFGVNLYMAGAADALSQSSNLSDAEGEQIFVDSVAVLGTKPDQARQFLAKSFPPAIAAADDQIGGQRIEPLAQRFQRHRLARGDDQDGDGARLAGAEAGAKLLLQIAERLATIGQFSASIGHELRNPLTSIQTFTALLREPRLDTFRHPAFGIFRHNDRIIDQHADRENEGKEHNNIHG